MKDTKVVIDNERLAVSFRIAQALAHPVRLKIIEYIDQEKSINVKSIYKSLNLEQSVTSQHLGVLKKANLVFAQRDGKFIHYCLNYPKLYNASRAIDHYFGRP